MANDVDPFAHIDAAQPAADPFGHIDATQPAKPMMGAWERIGTGMKDPVVGGAQLLRNVTPDFIAKPLDRLNDYLGMGALPTNANVQAREADIEATTPVSEISETTLDDQGRASHQAPRVTRGEDPLRWMGNVVSPMNLAAPSRAMGVASLGQRMGSAAVQGATLGMMQPVSSPGNYATTKTLQAGLGATTGAAIPVAGAGIKGVANWLRGAKGDAAIEDKAVQAVLRRIETDQKGGGPSFQDMLDVLNAAPDKPMVLADVGGSNLKSLLGRIARAPGEAKQHLSKFMNDRDLDAGIRLKGDVNEALGGGSAYYTDEALIKARSEAAKPLFEKAYEGGSIAPLKKQFQDAYDNAIAAEHSAAADLAHAEKVSHPGDLRSDAILRDLRAKWGQANQARTQIQGRLEAAKDDIANGTPGAVWNPRIQQFLDNPRIQQGIQRGLRIERDEALAEGRAMNPTDYAIVGTGADGEPVIGKVPTMRLLAVAKEGLDRILQSPEMRNELTGQLNKEGVAIDKMRRSFISELDGLNLDYKKAREAWSGTTDSIENLRLGQDIFKMEPEAITESVKNMTPNDREFFKLGAASTLRRMVAQTGEKGDETRRLIGTQYARDQLRSMFQNDDQFNKFFRSLNAEKMMFDTWAKTYGGSVTAERVAEDTSGKLGGVASGMAGVGHLFNMNVPAATHSFIRAGDKLLPKMNPADAAAQARLMTTLGPDAVARLQAALLAQKPPTAGVSPYLVLPAAEATTGMTP